MIPACPRQAEPDRAGVTAMINPPPAPQFAHSTCQHASKLLCGGWDCMHLDLALFVCCIAGHEVTGHSSGHTFLDTSRGHIPGHASGHISGHASGHVSGHHFRTPFQDTISGHHFRTPFQNIISGHHFRTHGTISGHIEDTTSEHYFKDTQDTISGHHFRTHDVSRKYLQGRPVFRTLFQDTMQDTISGYISGHHFRTHGCLEKKQYVSSGLRFPRKPFQDA